jgi:hypothetical protein
MLKRLAAVLLALAIGACAQIPRAELAQYRKAFAAVETTSTDILVNYDQTLERARLIRDIRQQPEEGTTRVNPYPVEFEEFLEQLESQQRHDIEVRRLALQVVARYNAVLVQLAEGKSVGEVETTAGELVTALGQFVEAAAGSVVPGFPAIVSLAKTFAGQLEKARLAREFKEAVENGAPVVDKILDQFVLDAADHYKLNAGIAQEQRVLILGDAVVQVGNMKRLLAGVGPPDGFASVLDRQDEVNTLLVAARGELSENQYPYTFESGPEGGARYTAAVDAQVELIKAEIGRLAGLYKANIQQARSLGEALAKYRSMLLETKNALATLRQAVDRPVNVLDIADQLLDLSFGIQRDLADLRAAIAAPS